MGYNTNMEITKAIIMEKEMADRIQELAAKERRSFAREAQVLIETALESLGNRNPNPNPQGKTA